jgi:hypothetical protein
MDVKAVRTIVNENPDGVEIRMIDGTVYRIPHRDYIWFTPMYANPEDRSNRFTTSFWLHDAATDEQKFVNALLISAIVPLNQKKNGAGSHQDRKPN